MFIYKALLLLVTALPGILGCIKLIKMPKDQRSKSSIVGMALLSAVVIAAVYTIIQLELVI